MVDVRSSQEFAEGHISGAISIPYYEIEKRANMELRDKTQEIILYCSTGTRTKKAMKILKRMGYINVRESKIMLK